MVQISYNGDNVKLQQAVPIANRILQSTAFYKELAAMPVFAYSTLNGAQVGAYMQGIAQPVKLETYWWPLSRVTAKTLREININAAKLGRTIPSIVNTLAHESVHYTDWAVNHDFLFTDRNANENPLISAPYKIGALAEMMVANIYN